MLEFARLQPQRVKGVDLLLVDGDGLAYYCAGADGTPIERAQDRTMDMIRGWATMTNAADVAILMTAEGSPKGGRYAVATVKPYQGQRASSRRPENWRALRRFLESGRAGTVRLSQTAEADDLFAYYSATKGWQGVALASQDKDMRMVPGLHVTWDHQRMFWVPPFESPLHGGKQYGPRWFWEQMLQGDTADNIPGLPLLYGKRCGEVGARKFLDARDPADYMIEVRKAYQDLYAAEGDDRLLEQACLLWMRRRPKDPLDMMMEGGPLEAFDNYDAAERLRLRATGEDA